MLISCDRFRDVRKYQQKDDLFRLMLKNTDKKRIYFVKSFFKGSKTKKITKLI